MKQQHEEQQKLINSNLAIAPGVIQTSRSTTKGSPRYSVEYNFTIPDGRKYVGQFNVGEAEAPAIGTQISVRYDSHDPNLSEAEQHPADDPTIFIYASTLFCFLLPFMSVFLSKQTLIGVGMKFRSLMLFALLAIIGHLVGRIINTSASKGFTVQDANSVRSSQRMSGGDPEVEVSTNGVWIAGQSFGKVPWGSHIWIRGKDVLLNGRPFSHLR